MQDHTKLLVWQKSRRLLVDVHAALRNVSLNSVPGLRSQMLRATMSIRNNICEGAGRATRPDFAHFISMATASANETEDHLTTAGDLQLIDARVVAQLAAQVVEIRRMLCGLHRTLLARHAEESRPTPSQRAPPPSTPNEQ